MQILTFLINNQWTYIVILCSAYFILMYLGVFNKLHFSSKTNNEENNDFSLIMSYYTRGLGLTNLSRGKTNNMNYTLYTTTSENLIAGSGANSNPGTLIYVLEMPFSTKSHIVGISKKYAIDTNFLSQFLQRNNMEGLELEGAFSNACRLFAQVGQGSITQYVLDPKAMQFIVDFCTDNFWEINGAELTIVKTENQKGGENLLDLSSQFAQEIRPAVEQKGKPVKHELPYGEYGGGELPCPICKTPMGIKTKRLQCPNGHGILINGRYVIEIRGKQLKIDEVIENPTKHDQIICPNCGNEMVTTNYQNTGVIIDSCTNCPFRWLDAKEADKISTKI